MAPSCTSGRSRNSHRKFVPVFHPPVGTKSNCNNHIWQRAITKRHESDHEDTNKNTSLYWGEIQESSFDFSDTIRIICEQQTPADWFSLFCASASAVQATETQTVLCLTCFIRKTTCCCFHIYITGMRRKWEVTRPSYLFYTRCSDYCAVTSSIVTSALYNTRVCFKSLSVPSVKDPCTLQSPDSPLTRPAAPSAPRPPENEKKWL